MTPLRRLFAASIVLVAGSTIVQATDVGGTISTNTTWTAALSPYVVISNVTVNAGVTLTVQPGVTVKFNSGLSLTVNGTLSAAGTSASRIRFTTNNATPAAGQWNTVALNAGSQASVVNYCDFEYGGAGSSASNLYVQSNATISNSTASASSNHGMRVNNANPTLTAVTFANNSGGGDAGLYLEGTASPVVTSCRFQSNYYGIFLSHSGTGADPNPVVHQSSFVSSSLYHVSQTGTFTNPAGALNFESNWWGSADTATINSKIYDDYDSASLLYVDYIPFLDADGGAPVPGNFAPVTIAANTTWTAASSPYIVAQTVRVNAGVTLTIQPGVTVKFGGATGMNVDGTLSAVGTAASRIVFTTNSATPAFGQWNSVALNAGSQASVINYSDFEYGGGSGQGNLYVLSNAAISNSTASASSTAGIRVNNANPTVTAVTFANNTSGGAAGLYVEGTASPTVTQCRFQNNWAGIYIYHTGTGADPNPVVHQSSFISSSPYHVYQNATFTNPAGTLNFENNWWGSADTAAINSKIYDDYDSASLLYVDYIPFLDADGGVPVPGNFAPVTVAANTTWTAALSPYIVAQTVRVNAGVTLTIQPGVTVKFGGGTGMNVDGTLSAVGTSGSRIRFTTNYATPAFGQWGAVALNPGSQASVIDYADFEYGGSGSSNSNLYVQSNAAISNTTASASSGYGMRVNNANPTVTAVTFANNTGGGSAGLYIEGTASPTLTQCRFQNNFYGIYIYHTGAGADPNPVVHQSSFVTSTVYHVYQNATFTNPAGTLNFESNWWGTTDTAAINNKIYDDYDSASLLYVDYIPFLDADGGAPVPGNFAPPTIATNTTWTAALSPYIVAQTVRVNAGVTLTIQPGVTVKFGGGTGMNVDGTLSAVGTSGSRIRFTTNAATPAAGQWGAVALNPGSQASVIDYSDFEYGGSGSSSSNLYVQSNATIRNSTASASSNHGMRVNNANPTVTAVTFANNSGGGSAGLYIEGTASPTLTQCRFQNNWAGIYIYHTGTGADPNPVVHQSSFISSSPYHVYQNATFTNPAGTLNFENNWWGTTDTAAINNKIYDDYDSASLLYVDYIPFLDADGGVPVPGNFVPRVISANTTWTAALSPYIVAQDVTVNAGVTLTIQPGVTVKFGGATGLLVNGTLSASGTTGAHITFTSVQATPASGQWNSLAIGTTGGGTLNYADILYGGAGTYAANLALLATSTVQNSTVRYSSNRGVYISGANPTISDTTIRDCTRGVFLKDAGAPVFTRTRVTNNTYGLDITRASGLATPDPNPRFNDGTISTNSWNIYVSGTYQTPSASWDFQRNWWGTVTMTSIAAYINDHDDTATLPHVDFIPYLESENGPEYHLVYNVSVAPSVINPDWGELAEIGFQTTINFTRATFRVYDATTHALVRTAGGNYGELWLGWDGRNDQGGIPTVEQLYYFTIEVRDESGHVAFWNTAGTPLMGPTPGLSNNVVTTPTFDPYRNDQFALDYTSSARGQVSITVINAASATIRTLFDHDLQDAGSHTVLWDGRKDDGSIHQGYFQIQLGPAYPIPDQAIFLHRPGAGFSNVRAEAYLIQSVHTEVSTIRYTLGGYADVTVAIRDPNGNFVKNVSVVAAQPPGTYAVEWDGRNGAGDLMALEGVYTVTLTARDVATGVTTTRKASITVYK